MTQSFGRYLAELGGTEWLPPADLSRYQRQLLERLARHARGQVPFYQDRLACLFAPDGTLDFSRWCEVPIVERADVATQRAAMSTPDLPELYGAVRETRTTGTTGNRLYFSTNALVMAVGNAAMTRMARWFGLDTARPLACITIYPAGQGPTYPDGAVCEGWSGANPEAVTYSLDLRTPVNQQLQWLLRHKAPYLQTTPSNALALSLAATADEARDLGIEFIFAISETVNDDAREIVAARLGARLAGIYSCEEIGFIATECPAAPHYHVTAENAVVEIIGADGRPAGPGELGRVVVTGLFNYAMPFIRYALGDVAAWASTPCRCGRSLPVLAQIVGRTRNAFVFKDGKRMWPRAWDARSMLTFVPCSEFQMVQIDHERFEFRYVPDGSGRAPDAAGLAVFAHEKMHPSVKIVLVPLDAIPRGPGGKFEQFLSHVPVDWSPAPTSPTPMS